MILSYTVKMAHCTDLTQYSFEGRQTNYLLHTKRCWCNALFAFVRSTKILKLIYLLGTMQCFLSVFFHWYLAKYPYYCWNNKFVFLLLIFCPQIQTRYITVQGCHSFVMFHTNNLITLIEASNFLQFIPS